MSGFELFDNGTKMRITYGDRTVLTTDGILVNLLPPEYDIDVTVDAVYPDFTKDYIYTWVHGFRYVKRPNATNDLTYNCAAQTGLTIPKQDWQTESTVATAPDGADIWVGRVTLSRTTAPTHSWGGNPIDPLQPMDVAIPFISGSMLMESEVGMARAMSLYVTDEKLKLHLQQSVATAPGGWGIYGDEWRGVSGVTQSYQSGGGENVYGAAPGIAVADYATVSNPEYSVTAAPFGNPPYDERSRRGGSNSCPLPNYSNYDFGSTYSVTIKGSFGRRSMPE